MLLHQVVFRTKWICYIHTLSKVLGSYLLLNKVTVLGFPGGSAVNNPPAMQETQEMRVLSPEGGHHNPLQYSWQENPLDRGAQWATVHGVAKNQTRLKLLLILMIFILIILTNDYMMNNLFLTLQKPRFYFFSQFPQLDCYQKKDERQTCCEYISTLSFWLKVLKLCVF